MTNFEWLNSLTKEERNEYLMDRDDDNHPILSFFLPQCKICNHNRMCCTSRKYCALGIYSWMNSEHRRTPKGAKGEC